MFEAIQHIGYLIDDLAAGEAWFAKAFGAERIGGGAMTAGPIVPTGGRNAFLRFGDVEVELMQPGDTSTLPKNTFVMHHVGYVVADMAAAAARARSKGLRFLAEAPYTNFVGQQVFYLDPATTNGVMIHLTGVPDRGARRYGASRIDGIVHPGYRVRDVDAAAAWYVDKLGGVIVGAGPSASGGRVAFVNVGGAQVELIERPDAGSMGPDHILDHVGYTTSDLDADMREYGQRGIPFATPAPIVNPIGQRLIYIETSHSLGSRMHLTQLPR
jgi:catechol 2,3-dioxygenase-like lactoylglutathione lyase family enzyme